GFDRVGEMRALPHRLLGPLGLVPELRVLGQCVQFVETTQRIVPVKDASSAGPGRIGSPPPMLRFPHAWSCLYRWAHPEWGANMANRRGVVKPSDPMRRQ